MVTSRPLTWLATMTGMPSAPKATGAVLATRQMPPAYTGLKPSPISMAAVMATGVPKPAVPSRNAPKAKAMNRACNRRSSVSRASEPLMISNSPDSTVMLYSHTAVSTIQMIGNSPMAMPYSVALTARPTGMPHTPTAAHSAPASPSAAAMWPLARRTASM
ncbi:hypothetical protein DSECCO2_621620 [anaerobic digester metagenome]